MASERELFRDFDRMRREMDELFGDVLDRRMGRRGSGFSPAVDVYYCGEPPKAVVRAQADHGTRGADERMTALTAHLFATEDSRNAVASFLAEGPGKATFAGR